MAYLPARSPSRIAVRTLAAMLALVLVAGCVTGAGGGGSSASVTPSASPARPSPSSAPSRVPSPTPSALATPSITPSPTASPSPSPTPSPVPTGPYEVNLYGQDDFVSQATKDSCVAGAMQTMLNVGDVTSDRTKTFQMELAALALELSLHPDGGTEPEGWAAGLERMGLGPYVVDVAGSRNAAILRAARAIRETGRPVGLLVWRGAHSWVMHGFRATADPLVDRDFAVTHAWISDPWYPRISSIWGESRPPNSLVPVAALAEDYLAWRRPTGPYPDKDGKFVLVKPVSP